MVDRKRGRARWRAQDVEARASAAQHLHDERVGAEMEAVLAVDPGSNRVLSWETVYNTIRPHQSLGYLTPAEYLASLGIDV
jgi:transposase InsO family protein